MKPRFALLLTLALSLSAVPAYAHHSFAAEFDGTKPVRLVGKITRVECHPHTYFYIDVVDAQGKVTNWGVEGASPARSAAADGSAKDLKIGGKVVVEGYRAKNGSNLADGRLVTLPDGRKVYGGSPGDGGPETTAPTTVHFPAPVNNSRQDGRLPMPQLQHLCQLLYDSSFGTMIRESNNAFPIIESIHVLSITLLIGTIAVLDLRMLGLVLRPIPVTRVARSVLPLTWSGFTVSFVSGFLLFWAEAAKNYSNPAFRAKLILLALAGLNPLIFHTTIYRRVHQWETLHISPWRARAAAIASLTLWSGVIVAGRAIAYF